MSTKRDSTDPEEQLSGTVTLDIYICFLQVLPSVQGHLRTMKDFFGNTPGPSSFIKGNYHLLCIVNQQANDLPIPSVNYLSTYFLISRSLLHQQRELTKNRNNAVDFTGALMFSYEHIH